MQRKEFFKKLADIYPKTPPDQGTQQYLAKLSAWKVTAKQLDLIYELVAEQCEFYPTIAQLTSIAGECGVKVTRQAKSVTFLTFDLNDLPYGIICRDPSKPPFTPKGAKNVHLCVSPDREYGYQQATPEEARAAFREGFLHGGGDPGKLDSYFRAATSDLPDELPF